jgi:hypothetical protein
MSYLWWSTANMKGLNALLYFPICGGDSLVLAQMFAHSSVTKTSRYRSGSEESRSRFQRIPPSRQTNSFHFFHRFQELFSSLGIDLVFNRSNCRSLFGVGVNEQLPAVAIEELFKAYFESTFPGGPNRER